MAFWIKVDVEEAGGVTVSTYDRDSIGNPRSMIRVRRGSTVSQALRALATAMVTAKAEMVGNPAESQ